MASKYSGVIDHLPKMLSTEPAYQEKVNQAKTQILSAFEAQCTTPNLASEWVSLRAEEDLLEEQASTLRLRRVAIEQLLTDQMESEGLSSLRLATGQSVSVQVEPYAQVIDKDALREWAIVNKLERSLSLPWMTVNALTKERLLAGESEPDGVQASARTKLVLRKG